MMKYAYAIINKGKKSVAVLEGLHVAAIFPSKQDALEIARSWKEPYTIERVSIVKYEKEEK